MPPEVSTPNPSVPEYVPPTDADDDDDQPKPDKTPPSGDAGGQPASDKPGVKPAASGSGGGGGFDVPDLLGGFKKTMGALADIPSWIAPAANLLPTDAAADPSKATEAAKAVEAAKIAEAAKVADAAKLTTATTHADHQDAIYGDMLHRSWALKQIPGPHTKDGASFVVDAAGRTTEFTTAPFGDNKNGMTYKNIKYDANGEMLSYDAPSGHHFQRKPGTTNDKDGFGTWQCFDANGRPASYAGANAMSWRAKCLADDTGFHTMISNDQNRQNGGRQNDGLLISRAPDGTQIITKVAQRDQTGSALQTKVVLPDGTEVTRNARLENGLVTASADAPKVTEAKKDPKGDTKTTTQPEVDPAKAKLLADGQRLADGVLKRIGDSPNPVAELSAILKNADNLKSATVTRRRDGKYQVDMHFTEGSTVPPINANIRGFKPGPTHVSPDISFVLSHSQNGISLEQMNGFSGSVTGPRGRVRDSWNNGMHIGRDNQGTPFVDVDSSVQGPLRVRGSNNRFYEQNFPEGSPLRQLMKHPDALNDIASALRMFQKTDDIQQITLKKTPQGNIDVVTKATESKHIPVDKTIKEFGVTVESLDLDKTLSASISQDGKGVRLCNMQGMSIKLKGLLGEMTITPKSVGLETNAEGVPVVHIEIEHPTQKGTIMPLDIPVADLQKFRNKKP